MDLHIYFWWRLGLSLRICRHQIETKRFHYLTVKLWFRGHHITISLYRDHKGWFGFSIYLPYMRVNNDTAQRVVEVEGKMVVVPVVTGKVFWWEVKIPESI